MQRGPLRPAVNRAVEAYLDCGRLFCGFARIRCGSCGNDFFTVHTATFRTLYVFVILSLERRRVIHFNVTTNSTAEWTSLQLTQAFPFDTALRYLIRDRDGYCERVIGSIRREKCLDQFI